MDCKFTSQSVKVNKTVFRQTVEQPFDSEFTLPDYCPDIKRVLKCRIVSKISQKSADGSNINLDGLICLTLLYADPDGGVRSYESQSQFSKSIDFVSDGKDLFVNAVCRTDYCNCRASTERSVDVHAAVSISVSVISCADTKILTDIDQKTVHMLRGTAPATSPFGRCEKYLLINDEISLPDRAPSIRNILRHDVTAVIKDKKIIGSKIIVKGDLIMNVLYFGEETSECEQFSDTVPFSQILDIPGITDQCTCIADADLIGAELNPRTGMSGEMRVVSVSAKIYLWAGAYCDSDVPYITDAYSTQYDMQLDFEDMCFEKVSQSVTEPCSVKKTLDIPVDAETRIIDMWCIPTVTDFKGEQNSITVRGTVAFCMLVRDKTGEPSYYERTYDFESKCSADLPDKFDLRCTANMLSCSGNISPDGAQVRAELEISTDIIEQTVCKVLCDAQFKDEKPNRRNQSSVIVYFSSDGERVWDIARRYSSSPEAISSVNSIVGETVSGNMTVVIP